MLSCQELYSGLQPSIHPWTICASQEFMARNKQSLFNYIMKPTTALDSQSKEPASQESLTPEKNNHMSWMGREGKLPFTHHPSNHGSEALGVAARHSQ